MQNPKSSNQSNSQPAFKTPQPAKLQSEGSRKSVQERLLHEQDAHRPPADSGVDEDDILQKADSDRERATPEDIDLANLQIGIANRLAD